MSNFTKGYGCSLLLLTMDRKHREILDSCYEDIVPRINIIKLWPKLFENKVFNRDDVNISRWTVRNFLKFPEHFTTVNYIE